MYKQNAWNDFDDLNEVFAFSEGYKDFISKCKTERLCVEEAVKKAKEAGYVDLKEKETLVPGDKVYDVNRGKNVTLFVIGNKPVKEGMRILGAHIDSPRMDLKQNPLYEKDGLALLDTHYYGGIKKYQWTTRPMSLIGVVCKKDGSTVKVSIGEDINDPVVGITEILIHLAQEQLTKTGNKIVEGEDLDVTIGSIPMKDEEKDPVKKYILAMLKEKYDIEEEDFLSAEIEVVPAGPARDYGLDRSMVAGYGHDDRICAYTSLMALLDSDVQDYTTCAYLVDKEEIGSVGATGARSKYFETVVSELLYKQGEESYYALRNTLTNCKMLSSDVSALVDPLYNAPFETKNSCFIGNGIVFNKYTGSRGKSGCNDANPEFFAEIRNVLDKNNVHYQTAELGKVDFGGGGTIAYIMANLNMDVIDAGVGVLNMHSPMEIASKADIYEAYRAYKAFLTL